MKIIVKIFLCVVCLISVITGVICYRRYSGKYTQPESKGNDAQAKLLRELENGGVKKSAEERAEIVKNYEQEAMKNSPPQIQKITNALLTSMSSVSEPDARYEKLMRFEDQEAFFDLRANLKPGVAASAIERLQEAKTIKAECGAAWKKLPDIARASMEAVATRDDQTQANYIKSCLMGVELQQGLSIELIANQEQVLDDWIEIMKILNQSPDKISFFPNGQLDYQRNDESKRIAARIRHLNTLAEIERLLVQKRLDLMKQYSNP